MACEIRMIRSDWDRFFDLLLLADPSSELIWRYLGTGNLFALYDDEQVCGVLVLNRYMTRSLEIKNVAVREDRQRYGYGRQLVEHAIELARQWPADRIIVGTGNSSLGALAFYQKMGFRFWTVERDFFVEHYTEPIFEDGIQCRDKVLLEIDMREGARPHLV